MSDLTELDKSKSFVYKDYLHKFLDTSSKPFLKEIVLVAALYFFYLNTSVSMLMVFFKYITLLILIRYSLSVLTQIHDDNKARYFVLNANIMMFTTLILLMNQHGVLVNLYLSVVLISSYSLLVISTKEHYTSDVLLTLFVTYSLFNNKLVNDYFFVDNTSTN